MKKFVALGMLGWLMAWAGPAQAIYRCETDGKVTYSDAACQNGKELNIRAGQDAAGLAQANRQLAGEKAEVKRLVAVRRKSEAQDEKSAEKASRLAAARQNKCALLAQRQQWAEEDARNASGKSAQKSKLKARRAGEKYQLACKNGR